MDRAVEGAVLLTVIEERVRELHRWEQWCRRQPNRAHWSPLRLEYRAECRALVRLLRKARALAAPVVERTDPVTAAKHRADCDCHYINSPAASEWAGDHHVYPAGVGR